MHIFARAQGQYLFPGSVDNKDKRVLGDSQLQKWWRTTLGDATAQAHRKLSSSRSATARAQYRMFYMLGGCTFDDSLGILSRPEPPASPSDPKWQYGHPYYSIRSPLPGSRDPPTLNDLIPAFQDDPKARQLTEWASSPIPYAGQDGDYDEIMEQIHKLGDMSSSLQVLRAKEMLQQREEERAKLLKDKDVESFWLVMGNRGECSAGHIAGFFVVVREEEAVQETIANADQQLGTVSSALTSPASLSYCAYVKLWSSLHNVDYSAADKASQSYRRWSSDVQSATSRAGIDTTVYKSEAFESLHVDNPVSVPDSNGSLKRREPPKQVNTLRVKKKKI